MVAAHDPIPTATVKRCSSEASVTIAPQVSHIHTRTESMNTRYRLSATAPRIVVLALEQPPRGWRWWGLPFAVWQCAASRYVQILTNRGDNRSVRPQSMQLYVEVRAFLNHNCYSYLPLPVVGYGMVGAGSAQVLAVRGATLGVNVQPSHTTTDVVQMVQNKLGIPVREHALIFEGAQLATDKPLSQCGLASHSTLHMTHFLCGGAADIGAEDQSWAVPDLPDVAAEELVGLVVNGIESEETICQLALKAVGRHGPSVLNEHGDCIRRVGERVHVQTVLTAAAAAGMCSLCRTCLEAGADVDRVDLAGQAPLHIACTNRRLSVARILLEHGACDEFPASRGGPLFVPCATGDVERTRSLLERGADVHPPVDGTWTPLLIACQNGQVGCMRLLLQHGADPDESMPGFDTALFQACCNGRLDCAEVLLEHGAGVDVASRDGATALFVASQNGEVACVRRLLESGAGVDKTEDSGKTPLWAACFHDRVDCARILLQHGASVDKTDDDGTTPLHVACSNGLLECSRLLIDRGAQLEMPAIERLKSRTPLHSACERNHRGLVLLLLKRGADPAKTDGDGRSAATVAREIGIPDTHLADALQLAEQDVNAGVAQLERLVG